METWDLYDAQGNRKYLTPEERQAFFNAIPQVLEREKRSFALMLYYTGCRISEALEVSAERVDLNLQGVTIRSLKRRKQIFRFVPLPPHYLEKLDDVHRLRSRLKDPKLLKEPLWDFNRVTGWTAVKKAMEAAEIDGIKATAKALRHSFVIAHQELGTPEHMIQKWLGWSSSAMMSVYGNAVGKEERNLASKAWQ